MQELEIINILKENDLSDVEVLKNEEEYVLVNFYFDFDKDLQDAAIRKVNNYISKCCKVRLYCDNLM